MIDFKLFYNQNTNYVNYDYSGKMFYLWESGC